MPQPNEFGEEDYLRFILAVLTLTVAE